MKALALLVFIPLQVLFIPLAIVVLATYKQLLVSKRLGVSQTGIDVMSGRCTMHEFGMREDEATVRMARVLPNYSPLGMWMALFPLWVYSRIAGGNSIYPRQVARGHEGIRDLVTARTRYFDAIIERRMPGVKQFVVMGAGYDTRCYGSLRAGPPRGLAIHGRPVGVWRSTTSRGVYASKYDLHLDHDSSMDDRL